MRARLRPAFVVTTCAIAAGCGSTGDPSSAGAPTGIDREPTATATAVATATASSGSTATATATASAAPKKKRTRKTPYDKVSQDRSYSGDRAGLVPLNPTDSDGRQIYADHLDGCYVEVPKAGEPDPNGPARFMPWVEPLPVDCPDVMQDVAWDECWGSIVDVDEKGVCICMPRGGNPPPPPSVMTCPANAAAARKKTR
jgi:hypothetical protein